MMDLLSPSATADFADRTSGPGVVQERTGLGQEDFDQLIQQMLGLQISPAQQLTSQTAMMGNIPALLNAQTNAAKIPIDQQNADSATTTAAARQGEVDFKHLDLETMDETERTSYIDNQLKSIALTGFNLEGNKVGDVIQQNAFNILRKSAEMPGLNAFIAALGAEKKFDEISRLLGIPMDQVQQGFFGGFGLKPNADVRMRSGVENPEGAKVFQQLQTEQSIGQIMQGFRDILETLPNVNQ